MKRYLDAQIRQDLQKKMVVLTGPRQVGKTTLSQQLLIECEGGQYLNFDVPAHRAVLLAQSWRQSAPLLVFDEIHKMRDWKAWLKGAYDGRAPGQSLLITGSARMDTFRQAGESLAGRYFRMRLHPLSVREWCDSTNATPRVGSPLSLASLARDLNLSPVTVGKYLDILESLFIVFVVRPWHRNIARATLQAPKVYFYDTGMVQGDAGLQFENLVACHLLKNVQWQQDTKGAEVGLHYVRTKDDAEVDFCLSQGDTLTHLIECKLSDTKPHRALSRFAEQWSQAQAIQLVRECKAEVDQGSIGIRDAAQWLAGLAV